MRFATTSRRWGFESRERMQHLKISADSGAVVEVVRGVEAVRATLKRCEELTAQTPFQTRTWLEATYQHLIATNDAEPCLVCVRRRPDKSVVCALPLVIARENGLKTVGFPEYGIADYGAPLISPSGAQDDVFTDMQGLWRNICHGLTGVDRIQLSNMPRELDAAPNPFAALSRAAPASHARFILQIGGTVKDHIASRGKKYRKEVERCFRLLDQSGDWTFSCVTSAQEKQNAFAVLEQLQQERLNELGETYRLNSNEIAAFYKSLLSRDSTDLQGQIFTLTSGATTIAVLYGVEFASRFMLLRIADAGGPWRRLSPGRLIVVEAMRHYVARGIKTFDLGIGDYPFKRGLGAEALPLIDIDQALTARAMPHVMLMQAKGWVRKHPRLERMLKAARQKMSAKA